MRWCFYLVNLCGLPAVTIMSAALFVACLATRRGRGAVLVAVAVPAAAALTELLKHLIDRTITGSLSFPSGHTTGIFAVVVAFAVLLIDPPRPRISAVVRVVLAAIAFLVGVTVAVGLVCRALALRHGHGGGSGSQHRGRAGDGADARLGLRAAGGPAAYPASGRPSGWAPGHSGLAKGARVLTDLGTASEIEGWRPATSGPVSPVLPQRPGGTPSGRDTARQPLRIMVGACGRRQGRRGFGSASGRAGAQRIGVHPSAACGLDFGESRPDLCQQVRQEQQHGIRRACGEPRRVDDGDVGPGHPQALFGW